MAGGKNIDAITHPKEQVAPTAPPKEATESVEQGAILAWDSVGTGSERNSSWFVYFGVIVALMLGWFGYQRDWFVMGIIVITSIVLLVYILKKKPETSHCTITKMGINVGEHFYPFSSLHSYWLVFHKKANVLNLVFLKRYVPALQIDLGDLDPVQVKATLAPHLPELEKHGESFADRIIRLLNL